MITLPSESTPASLEEVLKAVRSAPGQSLRLPIKVDRGGVFGFSGLAIQTALTWSRLHDGLRTLQLSPSYAEDPATRDRFAASPLGMVSLYLADEVKSGGQTIKRSEALSGVTPYVTAMQDLEYRSTVRGTGALLCCFQGARNEFLTALYSKKQRGTPKAPAVQSLSTLTVVLKKMLNAAHDGLSHKLGDLHIESLSNLVYQLFNNADIHTITNATGDIYANGVRGIEIRVHRFTGLEDIQEYFQGDAKLANYLMKVAMQTPNRKLQENRDAPKRASTFVELSVFDSGPGLSLRWHSAKTGHTRYSDLSLEEELEGVRKCFELHSTTQGSGNVGDGLVIAMRSMRKLKALMALRTGRLSLLQDFSSKTHDGFDPRHRFSKTPLLSEIAGASYTICFPAPN
jgi:hypothetical protein